MSDVPADQVDAARAYESLFVPALFAQWTEPTASAADLQRGQAVLDVACGTGVLTAEAAERVGASGSVAGVDPNPGMLTVAGERLPAVDWRQGTAEDLPFPDARFDAVVSQFGLMFFQDRGQALREMLRVLKPSGRLAVTVWDRIENIPGYFTEMQLIEKHAGTAAADAVRAPFALGDREGVVDLLRGAGAVSVSATTPSGRARFPSIRTMAEAELRGWLPLMGVSLEEAIIQTILNEAESDLAAYATVSGELDFEVTAHVVAAQKAA
ncbi:MAG: methyltransferase domain-containing protein [Acidobacteriota bacterium]